MKKILLYLLLFASFNIAAQTNNYSLEFDGSNFNSNDGRVQFGNNVNLGNNFSVCFWVKDSTHHLNSYFHELVNINFDFTTGLYSDTLFGVNIGNGGNGNNWALLGSNTSCPETLGNFNYWTYFSITYDNDSLKVYINANLLSQYYAPGYSLNGYLLLGDRNMNSSGNYNHNGKLDDVSLWNIVMDSTQIQQYMQCPPTGIEPGLVGYWNFEEGTGSTTADQTINANDGTLNVGVTWSSDVPAYNCCTPNTGNDTLSACDSYTWIDGNTYTSNNNTATYTLTNAAGCDSTITLDLTISPTPDNSITQNGASLTATQTGATYQWIDCDNFNAPITGEVNQVFFPSLSGNYAVEVTIGDCSSTSECRLVDFTGIDEIESLISVHPNPTKDEITLSIGTELLETGFVVTDNAGRIILTDTFKSIEQKVNLSGFDNGVYFIRTDKQSPVKIIKQ